ncbi:hypothetical protein SK069_16060 [Patulibacter brassicae]|uniref:Glycosyltransferase family 1 protein n=1 Tax=Patulibacter brassicae TaxID=1705717 RepID=A0ABU4VMQ1_9ACTN|nr:hypothetical protein [Patulibacter brassicae]MDX8153114.1 hypothetical protein [Patulibacter brassicae]
MHFGFDAKTPEELREVVAALRECGRPLVVTVHDLRNPHHADVALHDRQLTELVRGATALVTLTPGAAAAIEARWGRRARVIPHPHVVEPARMRRPRPARSGFVVGVHAKSLRANMDVPAVAAALAETVAELPDATLRIDLHDELLDPDDHWYAPDVAEELLALGRTHEAVEVRVHPYFSDDELWDYLQELDVSVLPYRFGTHSGWLEACHDLGTAVVVPDCGHYAEQGPPCLLHHHDEDGLDAASLRAAVRAAHADRAAPRKSPEVRIARRLGERRAIAAAHREVYEAALAAGPRP